MPSLPAKGAASPRLRPLSSSGAVPSVRHHRASRRRGRRRDLSRDHGSREAEIPGPEAGLGGQEGGRGSRRPGTSEGRSCHCSQEGSCDPAAETEKDFGGGHPEED